MKALAACFVLTLLILAVLAHAVIAERMVSVSVMPRVVMAGNTIRLTCKVPQHPDNRLLDYGVANYREHSQRQLDGEHSRMTWEAYVDHVPCVADAVYCAVLRADGQWHTDSVPLEVAGCDGH